MSKQFVKTMGYFALVVLLVSACQLGSAVTPTTVPTNPPSTAAPVLPTSTIPASSGAPTHPQASPDAVRVQFEDTTMRYSPGELAPNASTQNVFYAQAGQKITIDLTTEPASNVALSIWGADGTVLLPETVGIGTWGGTFPSSQDYYISLRSASQQVIGYTLSLRLPPLVPPEATRIQFQPNATSWYTPGDLAPNAKIRFVLSALGGQEMNVDLITEPVQDAAFLYIWSTDGTVYTLMSPTQTWTSVLPSSGDYYIEVRSVSNQSITYQLSVSIPPIGGSAPVAPTDVPVMTYGPKIAVDQPIRFDVGPLSVALPGTVISGERDRYRLNMLAGETLSVWVSASEGNAVFTIIGPDGNPLPGTEEGKDTNNWSVIAPADGSYAILVGSTRGNSTYTLNIDVTGP